MKRASAGEVNTMIEKHHADVLVVGAGASGIPAALAAARSGSSVILLEEDPVPGGAPVDMYVGMLCGGPRLGIFREMIGMLNARHSLSGSPVEGFNDGHDGHLHWYLPSAYLQVALELIEAAGRIRLVCGRHVSRPLVRDGEPNVFRGVVCDDPNGRETRFEADVTIDATGDALVAHAAGCESRYGREGASEYGEPLTPAEPDDRVQPCTWMYISHRVVPGPAFDQCELKTPGLDSGLGWWRGHRDECLRRNTGISLHWGSSLPCRDTRDPAAIAETQRALYDVIRPDLDMLRGHGFGVYLAPKLGVRESRRLVGEYVLSAVDLKKGAVPDDTIALSRYGLDAWGEKMTAEEGRVPLYGIPYRCLLPKGLNGLLVAGKAISGTHLAASSYRVQPSVAGIGQAAGVAAALAVADSCPVRDVPVSRLRDILLAAGALPACYDDVRKSPAATR